MFLPVGVVECIEGIANVIALPYVHHHNLDAIQIDMHTKEPKDKTARFFLIVEAQDRNELEQRVIEIKQILMVFLLDVKMVVYNIQYGHNIKRLNYV